MSRSPWTPVPTTGRSRDLAATARDLWQRAGSLTDDPATTLFFGRIDITGGQRLHGWYIGRRHVSDADGEPVVVDWRAEVATAFYRAARAEPMGVLLRRWFGVDRGTLTAYEDKHLLDPEVGHLSDGATSAIVNREIERPRVGPMRDIVATIQPEQDEIVRADVTRTICVQGAPGRARRRSDCTARRGCSTPSATGSPGPVCWSSGRTRRSWSTSEQSCRRSGRSR